MTRYGITSLAEHRVRADGPATRLEPVTFVGGQVVASGEPMISLPVRCAACDTWTHDVIVTSTVTEAEDRMTAMHVGNLMDDLDDPLEALEPLRPLVGAHVFGLLCASFDVCPEHMTDVDSCLDDQLDCRAARDIRAARDVGCPHCTFRGTEDEVDEHRATGVHNHEEQRGGNLRL